jgi:hypothetical protein
MRSDQKQGGSGRFFFKQAILLVITIVLVVLFTIPLLKTVKSAMNPGELTAKLEVSNNETQVIQNSVDVVRSKMLMGAGDEEAQEKLKKQVEELQRKLELKDAENKNLKYQQEMVQAFLGLVKSKPATLVASNVDVWQKLVELSTKILGAIGSLFSAVLFILSWWRTRRKPLEPASSSLA